MFCPVCTVSQPQVGNGSVSSGGSEDPSPSQAPKKKREDFTFDKIIGEGSYSTVSCFVCV